MSPRHIRRTGTCVEHRIGLHFLHRSNPISGIFVDVPIQFPRGTQFFVELLDFDIPICHVGGFLALSLLDLNDRSQIITKFEHRLQSVPVFFWFLFFRSDRDESSGSEESNNSEESGEFHNDSVGKIYSR